MSVTFFSETIFGGPVSGDTFLLTKERNKCY